MDQGWQSERGEYMQRARSEHLDIHAPISDLTPISRTPYERGLRDHCFVYACANLYHPWDPLPFSNAPFLRQVIAWYTFIAVWWSKRMTSLLMPYICSTGLWLFSFLYSSIFISTQRHPKYRFYLPTPVGLQLHLSRVGLSHHFYVCTVLVLDQQSFYI